MRQRSRRLARLAAATVAVALVLLIAGQSIAAEPKPRFRSARYGRKGAEIWAEFPRVTFAVGKGYEDDYDAGTGLGFGFGLMFAPSDNLAFEGRLLQSNHAIGPEDKQWDLDMLRAGARYTFMTEEAWQPFVGLGLSKLTLERDAGSDSSDLFERLTGYGGYLTTGVDFVYSSSWSAFLRADYTVGWYGHRTLGTEDENLDDALRGDAVSMTLGIAYRIPAW